MPLFFNEKLKTSHWNLSEGIYSSGGATRASDQGSLHKPVCMTANNFKHTKRPGNLLM